MYPKENGMIGDRGQHKGRVQGQQGLFSGLTLLFSENSFQDTLQLERPLWALARLPVYPDIILADVGSPAHTYTALGFLEGESS